MIGRTVSVLFELAAGDGWISGYTPDYLEVAVADSSASRGQIINVKVLGLEEDVLTGEPV